jgi:o-succinylbenzoate synthase
MALHTSLLHRVDALGLIAWKIYALEVPYVTGGVRKGLLVHVKNTEGEEKWAEVSPLPGRSAESLRQAFDQLRALFLGEPVAEIFPSVQFGLEQLSAPPLDSMTVRLYALLSGTPEEILKQARVAKEAGHKTVKVKIASLTVEDAQKVLHSLLKDFRLRVDCNSSLGLKEALSLFAPFDPSLFDYIEDPVRDIARLSEFTHPFALDETALRYGELPLQECPHFYGFILKPTVLGGKKGCTPLLRYAREHKRRVVFSSSFESGVGLLQIISLAKELNLLENPLGLDTLRFFKQDVLRAPLHLNAPECTVMTPFQVDLTYLTEIAHGTMSTQRR